MPSNALKGIPSVPCERGSFFFAIKITGVFINSGHKIAASVESDLVRGDFGCDRGDEATEL